VILSAIGEEQQMMKRATVGTLVALALGLSFASAQSRPSLQGVWRVVEVTTSGANPSTNTKPQPSLYVFTAKHYSITRVTSATPRPQPKDPEHYTLAERQAIDGPFQAQAGTWEVAGENLSLLPSVAKASQAMRGGIKPAVYTTSLQGDSLTLVQKSNVQGQPVTNPDTLKLTRVE
jgi:hypothetical protein